MSAMDPRSVAPNARAAVFAAVCTLLAVAAHRLMSASGIPVAVEAFGAAAVFCFARIAAARGERGLGSIALLVGGSQVGLHLLFQAVQASAMPTGTPTATMSSAPVSMPGMGGMSGIGSMDAMSGMSQASGSWGSSVLGTTYGMTIAHILAAAIAAWWLRRGEAALFGAVERARVVLGASWRMVAWWVAGLRPIRSARPAVPVVGLGVRQPVAARALLFTVIRRGPPPAPAR